MKWHTGVVSSLAGSPLKDWHDWGRGEVGWIQRNFLGLKFDLRGFFFLVCELCPGFGGCQNKLGFFKILLSGAVISIKDFDKNDLKLRYFWDVSQKVLPQPFGTSSLPYPNPSSHLPATQDNAVNSKCNIRSTR